MAPDSMSFSPLSVTSVGTRPSGLYSRMRSKSLPTDQLRVFERQLQQLHGDGDTAHERRIEHSDQQHQAGTPVEKPIDDPGGDHEIHDQEPEEELAAPRALLRFELHAQHRILRDVRIDARPGLPAAQHPRSCAPP